MPGRLLALVFSLIASTALAADPYPSRPIKWIVGYWAKVIKAAGVKVE